MKKHILTESEIKETQSHFMELCEYLLPSNLLLDEADENDDDNQMMGGPDDQSVPDGQPMSDDQQPQDQPQPTVDGFNPEEDKNESNIKNDEVGNDDEVINIDDLIKSQDESKNGIENLTNKFDKLSGFIDNVEKYMKQNEDKISVLKQEIQSLTSEFEKRNPTDVEKLEMRTNTSYPFNIKPKDYWSEKEATSNYISGEEPEEKKYTITQGDVQSATDWKSIANTLNSNLNLNPRLSNILKY